MPLVNYHWLGCHNDHVQYKVTNFLNFKMNIGQVAAIITRFLHDSQLLLFPGQLGLLIFHQLDMIGRRLGQLFDLLMDLRHLKKV